LAEPNDQVWSSGAGGALGAAGGAGWATPAQLPVSLVVTFGGLPAPCETTWVVRVQLVPPLLTVTTLTLFEPAGILP
jgi:hypothetical protein